MYKDFRKRNLKLILNDLHITDFINLSLFNFSSMYKHKVLIHEN